ncbi:unnamed protein product, partial [Cuscuta epithymum]
MGIGGILGSHAWSAPKVIITDQDPALGKAISHLLPMTYHRFCIWHVLSKVSEKAGLLISSLPTFDNIYHVIKHSETPAEFELQWDDAIKENGLQDNGWMSYMFQIREQWVPAYFKKVFSAGMSSTQRSETTHSFLKKFVYKGCGFNEFVTRFDRALSRQRERENQCDHDDRNGRPKLQYGTQQEVQLANIYTRQMFREFQAELHNCFTYSLELIREDTDHMVFILEFKGTSNETRVKMTRQVHFARDTQIACCSCKKMEFFGILCAHILRVLDSLKIYELPEYYILDRWKKGARRGIVKDSFGVTIIEDHRRALCGGSGKALEAFLGGYYELLDESPEDQEIGLKLLEEWRTKFKEHLANNQSDQRKKKKVVESSCSIDLLEPDHARHKGCGKRLKSSLEKSSALNRVCSVCKGSGHDKRNCPKQ